MMSRWNQLRGVAGEEGWGGGRGVEYKSEEGSNYISPTYSTSGVECVAERWMDPFSFSVNANVDLKP